MIAVNIGKTFLKSFNEKYEKTYNAKEFFIEEYFPLFFDEEKYMQWVTNSPLVQGIKKGSPPSAVERRRKLDVLIDKISNTTADASIAIGFPSLDITATTSGQISSMKIPYKEEDVYLSWIGSGLGIGIQGGLSIFFDKPKLLLDIYDGWKVYRAYLNKTPKLRANQINTWNGQWLAHRYDKRVFDPEDPTAMFNGISVAKDGGLEVATQSWTMVLIGVARTFPDSQLTGYVYNLGQTNTTVGFIPFRLPHIKRPVDLYEKYFGTSDVIQVEKLFATAFGFLKACQFGSIGVNAMQPKGLQDFIEGKLPVFKEKDEEKKLNFQSYLIWTLAMLNNEQLWERAQQFAASLSVYALSSTKGKMDKTNQVKEVLSAISQKQFLDHLIPLVKDNAGESMHEIAQLIHMMPKDNVPYFLTLIRLHYAFITK
ncbi:hypothetical protein DVR12_18240 [Chitinophaga silvatica]|uniref:Uncharacterized protein n=1 Tax=Chitinophaga silvatica TaxID=2282649 RepID=A0A3E1Y6F1_9BACT|nr:hypothetical protein [Chitinophaga silvatica]RFS20509.1 hypothetical protein DVR12_18240 [Chitinophaga silvatica]